MSRPKTVIVVSCPKCGAYAGEPCKVLRGPQKGQPRAEGNYHPERRELAPHAPQGCGTYAGAQVHARVGEEPCDECREARNRYIRRYRARTSKWRDIQAARNAAMTRLSQIHRDEFKRIYAEVLRDLRGEESA